MRKKLLAILTAILTVVFLFVILTACAKGGRGEDGQNGKDGVDGTSAFEIWKEKYGEEDSTEDDFLTWLKGEQGVSVVDAYVDEKLHLWIVLSNGTKIDAGYVGASQIPSEPAITAPTIIVSDATVHRGDADVEITIVLKNNPGITSALLKVVFDDTNLTLTDLIYNTKIGGQTVPPQSTNSPVVIYWTDGFSDVIGDWTLVTLRFTVSDSATVGCYDISVLYDPDDLYNANETNVIFDILNGKISVL